MGTVFEMPQCKKEGSCTQNAEQAMATAAAVVVVISGSYQYQCIYHYHLRIMGFFTVFTRSWKRLTLELNLGIACEMPREIQQSYGLMLL